MIDHELAPTAERAPSEADALATVDIIQADVALPTRLKQFWQRVRLSPLDLDWQASSACADDNRQIELEKQYPTLDPVDLGCYVCTSCVVVDECLTASLRYEDDKTVWGGLTHRQRKLFFSKLMKDDSDVRVVNYLKTARQNAAVRGRTRLAAAKNAAADETQV